MIPRRLKRPKMGLRESSRIECQPHRKWVRGFECCAAKALRQGLNEKGVIPCAGQMEAHHSKTRGAWGGDETVVPLCHDHHMQLDSPGWSQKKFEAVYRVDFADTAARLWNDPKNRHRIRYEDKRKDRA